MLNSLSKVSYGYTDKGNRYEKSSDGKKTGKIAGATLYVGTEAAIIKEAIKNPVKKAKAKDFFNLVKGYVKNGDHGAYILEGPKMERLRNLLNKSKIARGAVVVGSVLAGVSIGYMALTGLGKLIGHGYDKIVDHFTMKKADKVA